MLRGRGRGGSVPVPVPLTRGETLSMNVATTSGVTKTLSDLIGEIAGKGKC